MKCQKPGVGTRVCHISTYFLDAHTLKLSTTKYTQYRNIRPGQSLLHSERYSTPASLSLMLESGSFVAPFLYKLCYYSKRASAALMRRQYRSFTASGLNPLLGEVPSVGIKKCFTLPRRDIQSDPVNTKGVTESSRFVQAF